MSENVVAKYGGTSMSQPEVVASVVDAYPEQKIVVVSAPGKLDGIHDVKVTDLLINLGNSLTPNSGEYTDQIEEIADRYTSAYQSMGRADLDELKDQLVGDLKGYSQSWRFPHMGSIVSIGEEYSAKYFAKLVGGRYIDPVFFRFKGPTSDFYRDKSYKLIKEQRSELLSGSPAIVPGCCGYHDEVGNDRALFERGGSDRSGAALASALEVDYQNWTDVNGVYNGDPNIVANPQIIKVLSRDEVREGAHGGNPVLQGDSIIDLAGSNVVINIRNTFNPSADGTLIVPRRKIDGITQDNSIVAVTGRDDALQINIRDLGMAGRIGYVNSITHELERMKVSLQHMPTSQDSLSLIIHSGDTERDMADLGELKKFIESHSASVDPEISIEERGVVHVVGEALRNPHFRHGATERVMKIAGIGSRDVLPIFAVNSPSIAILTDRGDTDGLVRDIHRYEIENVG